MLSVDNMSSPTRREKSDVRKRQIVSAALALLADSSLDQLSTRQIAKQLGLSQPALFRHFASKETLLLAVVEEMRGQLAVIASDVLERHSEADERLRHLARALFQHLDQHPGLPRLLFAHAAIGSGPLFGALRQLHATQASLIGQLVRQGQQQGVLDPKIDPHDGATSFTGLLQGATLSRRLSPRPEPLQMEGARLFEIWLHGMRPGIEQTSAQAEEPSAAEPAASDESAASLQAIDARPLLSSGVDPFDTIVGAVASVGSTGAVSVTTPFHPAPLVTLLSERGHDVSVEKQGEKQFHVQILGRECPGVEDLRELEAPEPLERCLSVVSALRPGDVYLARLPRYPRLLIPQLDKRGAEFEILEEADGSALLWVTPSQ